MPGSANTSYHPKKALSSQPSAEVELLGPKGLRREVSGWGFLLSRLANIFQPKFAIQNVADREPGLTDAAHHDLVEMMGVVQFEHRPARGAPADLDAVVRMPGDVIQ